MNIDDIRCRLIKTMHSSKTDDEYLIRQISSNNLELLKILVLIANNQDDFGDAPIAASYYIKEFKREQLQTFENEIFEAFESDERCARIFLAIALAKLDNKDAYELISNLNLEFDNWILKEALKIYEKR